jgi:glycosyltransferase involved in cell wall biosynthesis
MQSVAPAMTSRMPVSVLVPIKNEAENLPRCLNSVRWVKEIFVVDSKSIDGSAEIVMREARVNVSGTSRKLFAPERWA